MMQSFFYIQITENTIIRRQLRMFPFQNISGAKPVLDSQLEKEFSF